MLAKWFGSSSKEQQQQQQQQQQQSFKNFVAGLFQLVWQWQRHKTLGQKGDRGGREEEDMPSQIATTDRWQLGEEEQEEEEEEGEEKKNKLFLFFLSSSKFSYTTYFTATAVLLPTVQLVAIAT